MRKRGLLITFMLFLSILADTAIAAQPEISLWPQWASAQPARVLDAYPGDDVHGMMKSLKPGDKLIIHGGTYSESSWYVLELQGTAHSPIFIEGAPGEEAVITRPDANQNNINIDNSQYISMRNIRFRGGDTGIKIYNASNIIIEDCEVYETDGAGITANSADTSELYFMHNHIHHTGGHGEGYYLGANNAEHIMSHSVVYNNLIHDTTVHNIQSFSQGDGIEIKQGSFDNLIKDNVIYNVPYPGIIVYGTDGMQQNVVEGNLVLNSGDNGIQAQGDAIVRNNIVIDSSNHCVESKDHQGTAANLQVLNNVLVSSGSSCVRFANFGNRQDMVLANNVIYNPGKTAIQIDNGRQQGIIKGNVVLGTYPGEIGAGIIDGNSIENDFIDAAGRNYYPKDDLFAAQPQISGYNVDYDYLQEARPAAVYAGAFEKINSSGYAAPLDFKYPARDTESCTDERVLCVDDTPGDNQEYSSIQAAADAAGPGDTVIVFDGTYDENVHITRSGSSQKKIVIRASGTAAMKGFDIDADNIIIRGFDITSTGNAITFNGNGIEITGNNLHQIQRYGITGSGTDITVSNNKIHQVQLAVSIGGFNVLFENNEITKLYDYGTLGDSDYTRFFGRDIIVRNNFFHDTIKAETGKAHIDCIQTFDVNGDYLNNLLYYNNTCYDFDQGFMGEAMSYHQSGNITFDHNIFAHGNAWGIDSIDIAGVKVTHNTFYDIYWYGVGLRNIYSTGGIIKNNIFYGGPDGGMNARSYMISDGAAGTADYNMIYNAEDPDPVGNHDIIGTDPLFTDAAGYDFRPLNSSLACGNGENDADIGALPCSSADSSVQHYNCGSIDSDSSGKVENDELLAYIRAWYSGSSITAAELMDMIDKWKNGC